MTLRSRASALVQDVVERQRYDVDIRSAAGEVTLTDPHGRGASLAIEIADDSHVVLVVGASAVVEEESTDLEGLLADIEGVLERVLNGGLVEEVWRRSGKIVASRLIGLGYRVSYSTLTPRALGSKETIRYSAYRKLQ